MNSKSTKLRMAHPRATVKVFVQVLPDYADTGHMKLVWKFKQKASKKAV